MKIKCSISIEPKGSQFGINIKCPMCGHSIFEVETLENSNKRAVCCLCRNINIFDKDTSIKMQ